MDRAISLQLYCSPKNTSMKPVLCILEGPLRQARRLQSAHSKLRVARGMASVD